MSRFCSARALVLATAVAAAGCASSQSDALYCYVGGTMRPAVEELARQFQAETGTRVVLDYGDSGSNFIKVETTGRGDLYVAHDPFHGAMVQKGLTVEGWAVASLEPQIAVLRGNPKAIRGLADLAKPGVRLVLTDPVYSTAGHVCRVMFAKAGLAEAIEKNVVTRTRAGGEAANAVVLGHADAAIVWNAVIFLRRESLDAVPIEAAFRPDPSVDAVTSATFGRIDMSRVLVTVDVLRSSRRPEAARAFAEFAGSERGRKVWEQFGFGPAPEQVRLNPPSAAPRRDATPAATGNAQPSGRRLLLYCGAGLRAPADEACAEFLRKTGIAVETDYGGSGMIISRLRLAGRGDLFMPGDLWYVELAEQEGLIASKAMVCYLVPVILVPKGNPKNIHSVADLARPGLRVGLGNPKACQIGQASEKIFVKCGVGRDAIEKNLVFSSVTVNELGLQIQTGGLDATIVWDAVAAQYATWADAVAIPPQQNTVSGVAAAVLKSSTDPQAARAFLEFLTGPEGQAIFRKHQYRTDPL